MSDEKIKTIVVRMLTSIAGANFEHHPGDIAEVPEADGKGWIASGAAEAAPKAELERQRALKAEAAAREAGGREAELERQLAEKETMLAAAVTDIAVRDATIETMKEEIAALKAGAPAPAAG